MKDLCASGVNLNTEVESGWCLSSLFRITIFFEKEF